MGQAYRTGVIVAVIDSNAVDPLVDDEDVRETIRAAIADGRLRLLSTHVTYDEIEATKDGACRVALLTALSDFSEAVPTGAFVLNVSRLGMARLSDDVEAFEEQRSGQSKHTHDALIAVTAQYEGSFLVTHDKGMRRRAESAGIPVCDMRELIDKLAEESRSS